jgi:hypothetical protein
MDDKELLVRPKYPISKHGKECLGPCYEPGTSIIHPISLDYISHQKHAFCPTEEWLYEDPKTGKQSSVLLDFCSAPTKKADIGQEDIEMNILVPKFNFSCDFFLKMYYKIYSFDEAINWINNKGSTPLFTKMRILECSLKNWGDTDQFVVTDDLINFFMVIIKKRWIKDIYSELSKYIAVKGDKISLARQTKADGNNKVEKINYIINKVLNPSIMYTILSKYHDEYIDKWKLVRSHLDNIKLFMIDYLDKKLAKTIKD